MLWHTQKFVDVGRAALSGHRSVFQRVLAIACCVVFLTCSPATPLAARRNASSKSSSNPGKILRTALPDETWDGERCSVTFGTARVEHAILQLHARESAILPRIAPIPSVLYLRPAADRAPPRS